MKEVHYTILATGHLLSMSGTGWNSKLTESKAPGYNSALLPDKPVPIKMGLAPQGD